MNLFFIIFFIFLFGFHKNEVINRDFEDIEKQNCYYLKNYEASYDKLLDNPRHWLLDDSCGLEIISLTTKMFIKTNDPRYLNLINEICRYSDGCISEVMDYEIKDIIQHRIRALLNHLKGGEYKHIEKFMIYWIIGEFSGENWIIDESKFNKFIKKMIKSKKIDKMQFEYLKILLKKAIEFQNENQ